MVGGLRSSLAGGASLPAPSTKAMNNYMGIGIDAKVALEFHQMRDQVPVRTAGLRCAVTASRLPTRPSSPSPRCAYSKSSSAWTWTCCAAQCLMLCADRRACACDAVPRVVQLALRQQAVVHGRRRQGDPGAHLAQPAASAQGG